MCGELLTSVASFFLVSLTRVVRGFHSSSLVGNGLLIFCQSSMDAARGLDDFFFFLLTFFFREGGDQNAREGGGKRKE